MDRSLTDKSRPLWLDYASNISYGLSNMWSSNLGFFRETAFRYTSTVVVSPSRAVFLFMTSLKARIWADVRTVPIDNSELNQITVRRISRTKHCHWRLLSRKNQISWNYMQTTNSNLNSSIFVLFDFRKVWQTNDFFALLIMFVHQLHSLVIFKVRVNLYVRVWVQFSGICLSIAMMDIGTYLDIVLFMLISNGTDP